MKKFLLEELSDEQYDLLRSKKVINKKAELLAMGKLSAAEEKQFGRKLVVRMTELGIISVDDEEEESAAASGSDAA